MPLGEGWRTGSGLLENEDVWIESCVFGYDADYNQGQIVCCIWQVKCGDGRSEKVLLPCGKGWEPTPGGVGVRREDGNERAVINNQTAYGEMIESVKKVANVNPALMGVLEGLEAQGKTVKVAQTWVGLGFHVIRRQDKFTINGEERTRATLMADAFLGAQQQQTLLQVPQQAPQPVIGGVVPVIGPPPANGQAAQPQSDPAMAMLTALAKTSPDHQTFMGQAFQVPGVMGNKDLEVGVTDTSDLGLYATLRK